MATKTRRALIEHRVLSAGEIGIQSLAEEFGVSEMTIRRDIDALEDQGVVRKVTGGAIAANATEPVDDPHPDRDHIAIAQRVAATLVAGQSLLLLASGMSHLIATAIARRELAFRVVTNDVASASALARQADHRVHLLGGELLADRAETVGAEAAEALRALNLDVAILSGLSLHADRGVTSDLDERVPVLRAAVHAGRRVVLAAPRECIGQVARTRVCEADQIDTIVTVASEAERLESMTLRGVETLIAPSSI